MCSHELNPLEKVGTMIKKMKESVKKMDCWEHLKIKTKNVERRKTDH